MNFDPFAPPEQKIDYTKFKNGNDLIKACGDEGKKWATAFIQYYKQNFHIELDEDFCFMFFANVIETAKEIEKKKHKMSKEEYDDLDFGKFSR